MKAHSIEKHASPAFYISGFALALLLTLIAFGLVVFGTDVPFDPKALALPHDTPVTSAIPREYIVLGVFILAILQILVHLRFFLHLNFSSEQIWNIQALVFTLFINLVMVGGTLWIMSEMNILVMPHSQNTRPLATESNPIKLFRQKNNFLAELQSERIESTRSF